MAIKEWVKLNDGQSVPLERALASFDQFVLHEREGDMEEVSIIKRTVCCIYRVFELMSIGLCAHRQCRSVNSSRTT